MHCDGVSYAAYIVDYVCVKSVKNLQSGMGIRKLLRSWLVVKRSDLIHWHTLSTCVFDMTLLLFQSIRRAIHVSQATTFFAWTLHEQLKSPSHVLWLFSSIEADQALGLIEHVASGSQASSPCVWRSDPESVMILRGIYVCGKIVRETHSYKYCNAKEH